jgi:hypothetical protein
MLGSASTICQLHTSPPSASGGPALRRYHALAFVAICVGVLLRAVQYSAQSSLWLDEAALARNIVDRPFLDLLRPLDHAQVAPVGFLWLERAAVLSLGPGELSLRLVPMAASVAALVLFTVLAFRILPGAAAALAVWLFATAVPMVFFAADLKPYSFDVLAAVTIVLVVATATRRPGSVRTAVGIGLLGALAWFSSVVPFLLAGTGIALGAAWVPEGKGRIRHLGVIAGLWLALAGPAVAIAIRNVRPAQAAYLHQRWADAFMPRRPGAAPVWVWDTLMNVVGQPGSWELNGTLQYGAPMIIVALAAAGCWWMLRHHVTTTLLLLLPAVVTLAASWLGLYPFTGRFILFLLPSLLIMLAAGTVQASRLLSRRWVGGLAGALVVVIAARATVRTRPPQRFEDLKPVLRTLAQERRAGDAVYVYYGASQAFLFYGPSMGFTPGTYVIGRCARDHPEWLIREVEQLRNDGRVWIVVSHASNQAEELRLLLTHLDSNGRQLQHIVAAPGDDAQAYLFSVPTRARQSDAPEFTGEVSWECSGPVTETPVAPENISTR